MGIASTGATLSGNKLKFPIWPVADHMEVKTAHIIKQMMRVRLKFFFFDSPQLVRAKASKMNFRRIEKLMNVSPIKATEIVFMF
jgi:macrodomain Ter protein organizer (MatP/YcbG family)